MKYAPDCLSFSNEDGSITIVLPDQVFEDDHPYVKRFPNAFRDHELVVEATPSKRTSKVEQATAAPGESREAAKPKK